MDTFNKEREQESEEQRTHKVVLGSMEVAALYPSLDSKEDAHTAGQLVKKHSCLRTSFCWLEGARFLALSLKPAEIQQLGLQHVVHTRKHQGGAAPGLTTLETATPLHHTILEQSSKLNPPEALASEEEKKDILAAVVSKAIQIAMSEHVYHFNGTVYRQEKGGPMGNTLSGELARSTMLRWDQALLDILKKHTIIDNKMYKRYVDDQLGAYRELQPGVRWNQETNSLDIDENQVEPDKLLPGDQRTMAIVRQLANTINKRIVMVEDFPSKHQGGKMPVLDLQCWVEENGYLRWEHYSKPMSNPLLPLNISALPARMRRTTQIQEGMRIMRNCHQDLDWSIVAEHLSELMKRLQMSGYPHRYRESILKSVLAGHETKRARAAAPGGRPLHRSDEYHRDERAKIKARQGKLWYRRGGFDTVLFVPPTPGSILANKLKKMEEDTAPRRSWRFRVIETGGRTIKSQLQTPNPASPSHCGAEDCLPCITDKFGICGVNNVTYQISCTKCGTELGVHGEIMDTKVHHYIGETSRNLRTRSREHLRLLRNKDPKSALWKHNSIHHEASNEYNFTMTILQRHKDPLTRQIAEGVHKNSSARHPYEF